MDSVVKPSSDQDSVPDHSVQNVSAPNPPVQETLVPPIPVDRMAALVALVEDSVLNPEVLVSRGSAPVPKFIGLEPPAERAHEYQAFCALMGMAAMIRLFAAINQVAVRQSNGRPTGYSIKDPKEIGLAFAEGADTAVRALTGGLLATLYSFESGQTQTANQLLKRTEIHDFVLKRVFGGVPQIDADVLKKLDEVLTTFVSQIKSYRVTKSPQQPTMNHCVVINYVRTTDLTGSGEALVVEPYTRLVVVNIKADEWDHALQKPGFLKKNEKISFSMDFVITEMKLDEAKYRAAKPKWEQVLQLIVSGKEELKEIVDEGGIEGFGRQTSILYDV